MLPDISNPFFFTGEFLKNRFEANTNPAPKPRLLQRYFDRFTQSKKMLNNVKQNALNGGTYYANWDILMAWFAGEPCEVAILGKEFDKHYLPNVFFSGGKSEGTLPLLENKLIEGQTTIHMCQKKACKFPVTEVKEALEQIFK